MESSLLRSKREEEESGKEAEEEERNEVALFDSLALQMYVLICCQDAENGGVRDKPPMRRDIYHTFYGLAGLSLAQHKVDARHQVGNLLGDDSNALNELNPVHGVDMRAVVKAKKYYYAQEVPKIGE